MRYVILSIKRLLYCIVLTDRLTDTGIICNNSLHLMHSMQPNNKNNNNSQIYMPPCDRNFRGGEMLFVCAV